MSDKTNIKLNFRYSFVLLLFSCLVDWGNIHAQTMPEQALLADLGLEMLLIPGGQFNMGSESGDANEQPVHLVDVDPFFLSKYEISFKQRDSCISTGGCRYNPADANWGRGDRPVMLVAWTDVQIFVNWLNKQTSGGFRLPSEAEWEYAARAGSTNQYSWGEQIDCSKANYGKENGQCGFEQKTVAIGRYAANIFGLHDMHGNVSEWVEDCYQARYSQVSPTGEANTEIGCEYRVLRGGSWLNRDENLRLARRIWYQPEIRYNSFGFRLARDLSPD